MIKRLKGEDKKMKRILAKIGILLVSFVVVCSLTNPVMAAGLEIAVSSDPENQILTVTVTKAADGSPVKGAMVEYILNQGTPIQTFTDASGISTWKPQLTGTLVINAYSDTVLLGTRTVEIVEEAVQTPSVTVRYPNGGESIVQGTSVEVSAHATDDVGVVSVVFNYSSDGGTTGVTIGSGSIVSGNATDGIWNITWDTTEVPISNEYLINAIATDSDGITDSDTLNTTFAIARVWRWWHRLLPDFF